MTKNKKLIDYFKIDENAVTTAAIAVTPSPLNNEEPIKRVIGKKKRKGSKIVVYEDDNTIYPKDVQDTISVHPEEINDNINQRIDLINKDIVTYGVQLDDNTIVQFYIKPKDEDQIQIMLDQMILQGTKLKHIIEELDDYFVSYRVFKAVNVKNVDEVEDRKFKPRDYTKDSNNLGTKFKEPTDRDDKYVSVQNISSLPVPQY